MAALVILLVATGCTRTVAGQARGGEPVPGADFFFQGEQPDYGQKLDAQEKATLTYARALRRVDPCGFATALKEYGDPGQVVGDFQMCYASVKVTGDPTLTEVSYEYSMQDKRDASAAFRVGLSRSMRPEKSVNTRYLWVSNGCRVRRPVPHCTPCCRSPRTCTGRTSIPIPTVGWPSRW